MGSKVCLSFDVEEWDSPVYYGVESKYSMSTDFSAKGCRILLDLFDRLGVNCTFFVTGVVAEKHPALVKEMVAKGHEVGCHGHVHRQLSELPQDDLKTEVQQGLKSIKKASGIKAKGFRSPQNRINPHLYEVLSELSFEYDSSVHPAILPGRVLDVLKKKDMNMVDDIVEVPISTLFGLPISWWWMRNIHVDYTLLGCEVSLRRYGYALIYIHPWELTDMPHVEGVPQHITRNVGGKARDNVEKLVLTLRDRGYEFSTIDEIVRTRYGG